MEAERFMLYDPRIQLESGHFQPFSGARMTGIKDRHIILLRQLIDRGKKRKEVLLRIDILFPVCGQKNIPAGFETQFLQYI